MSFVMRKLPFLLCARVITLLCVSTMSWSSLAFAQVQGPNNRYVFEEDIPQLQKRQSQSVKQLMQSDPTTAPGQLDFRSPNIEYIKGTNKVKGSGGIVASYEGIQVQADQGIMDLKTKDAEFKGRVLMTTPESEIVSRSAKVNIDNDTGTFEQADLTFEDGGYRMRSNQVKKTSEFRYEFGETQFSTCHCEDGSSPWCISSKEADATLEGYAHGYGNTFDLWGVPIFYTPWVAFPAKKERASGLLVPEWGYSSQDGVKYSQPIYGVIDDYSDIVVRPFIESQTRRGAAFDYRHAVSRYHQMEGSILFSDESPREGDLRGTVVTGLADPTIDENRLGGYYKQSWRSAPESDFDLALISDVHYVSDDLFLREIDDERIGLYNSRYTTSQVAARSGLGDYGLAEVRGEYNQSMLTDDDTVLQRLPEANVILSDSFRPFGYNPYGLKLVTGVDLNATQFARDVGYDGSRYNVSPVIKVPFHYKNYFNSEFRVTGYQTEYQLDDTSVPTTGTTVSGVGDHLDETATRQVARFDYRIATELERVYDMDPGSPLAYLSALGSSNQDQRLRRVKHVIEPQVSFTHIPDTTQDQNPYFDSLDRMNERSLVTYGVRSSWQGRFDSPRGAGEEIAELTPRVDDLPMLGNSFEIFPDLSEGDTIGAFEPRFDVARKNIRELAFVEIKQSYDYKEYKENNDPLRNDLSDVGLNFGTFPSSSMGLVFESNIDPEDHQLSSWGLSTHFRDDRGDVLRARYTFIDNQVSQIEGNVEVKLTDRLAFGTYGRFDDLESEFIESEAAFRLKSACNCWYFDFGYGTRINPDREQVLFRFTFRGLGDIAQDVRFQDDSKPTS
jgi:LPS-assembly protein